jgi:hypothetical protein
VPFGVDWGVEIYQRRGHEALDWDDGYKGLTEIAFIFLIKFVIFGAYHNNILSTFLIRIERKNHSSRLLSDSD